MWRSTIWQEITSPWHVHNHVVCTTPITVFTVCHIKFEQFIFNLRTEIIVWHFVFEHTLFEVGLQIMLGRKEISIFIYFYSDSDSVSVTSHSWKEKWTLVLANHLQTVNFFLFFPPMCCFHQICICLPRKHIRESCNAFWRNTVLTIFTRNLDCGWWKLPPSIKSPLTWHCVYWRFFSLRLFLSCKNHISTDVWLLADVEAGPFKSSIWLDEEVED